ncbi:MAG: AAA family ATPase [Verrucomicrobiia bacterium]
MSASTYLYAENFRGFSKTVIPVEGVNFLVGENSTGKTSILALFNLLSSHTFWFNLQFNGPDHEFGGFRDIISTRATENVFTVGGIQRVNFKQENFEGWFGILAAFQEFEGLPTLASIAQII